MEWRVAEMHDERASVSIGPPKLREVRLGPSGKAGLALAFVAGAVLAAAITAILFRASSRPLSSPKVDPILHEAWGSLLDLDANVLICLDTAAKLVLLPYDLKLLSPFPPPLLEAPGELRRWYLRRRRFSAADRLYMIPDDNSPHFGDAAGAMLAIRALTAAGASFHALPGRVVPTADLLQGNVMLFGAPHKSEAVRQVLARGKFDLEYDQSLRDFAIVYRGRDVRGLGSFRSRATSETRELKVTV